MSHTRIVAVTVTETITRQAHLRIDSDHPIDQDTLANPDVADLLQQAGMTYSCEHDSGADYGLALIEPDQEHRYRFSVDSHLDISCLTAEPAGGGAGGAGTARAG